MSSYIVFGSSGSLGQAIVQLLRSEGNDVTEVTRDGKKGSLSSENPDWISELDNSKPIDGVVWAQGANSSNSIKSASSTDLSDAFSANVSFIHETARSLLAGQVLSNPSRAVVLSSIWQQNARQDKFTYMVTKSALEGLVKSIAIDCAEEGLAINAVLPGVIDTPMTRTMLDSKQLRAIESSTLGGSLATPSEVAEVTSWLLSQKSSGVNGQFITVDKGWTVNRHV